MPNFRDILNETTSLGSTFDVVRRKYIRQLADLTNRNVIVYYSGWLQKILPPEATPHLIVNDQDKNGFMATIHQLDRSKGLDLILHTPGGNAAATESIVDYLRQMFGTDIRAIVPQLAMSAGSMIALSCKEILMGKHSSLGPIDPQINNAPAHGIIEEFTRAAAEIQNAKDDRERAAKIAIWQPIIAKYSPTLIGECQHALKWSSDMVSSWLRDCMFAGEPDAETKAISIVSELGSHAETRSHDRHIPATRLQELGVKVTSLEASQELQDAVLSVHHACTISLSSTQTVKIIENQNGVAAFTVIQVMQQIPSAPAPAIPMPQPPESSDGKTPSPATA